MILQSENQKGEYPSIEPIPDGFERPFWSIMIPTYNRGVYLEKTIRSILKNNFNSEHVQIEIVDNCSTEIDIEKLVNKIGDPRVAFFRQPYHVSMSNNWTTCIQRARGKWIHILHDDDMVLQDFYKKNSDIIHNYPDLAMIFCRTIIIDENDRWIEVTNFNRIQSREGILQNATYNLIIGNFIHAPSVIVSRNIYENIGGFSTKFNFSPDWEMWIRIATFGKIYYIDQPYFLYRIHKSAETNKFIANGEIYIEFIDLFNQSINFISQNERKKLKKLAYNNFSYYAMIQSYRFLLQKNYKDSISQAKWAFKLFFSIRSIYDVIKINWIKIFGGINN